MPLPELSIFVFCFLIQSPISDFILVIQFLFLNMNGVCSSEFMVRINFSILKKLF